MGGANACLDKQVSKCVRRREVLSGTEEGPCSSGQAAGLHLMSVLSLKVTELQSEGSRW